MNFKDTLERVENSEEYKKFKEDYPDAEICVGFFILDFLSNDNKNSIDYKDKDTPKIAPTAAAAAPTPPAPLPVLTAYRLACPRCYHQLVKPTSVNSTQTCTNCGWYS